MEQITQICLNIGAIFLAWAIWHYGWKSSSVNEYRQELFSTRDKLFLYGAHGKAVRFREPEYQEMRMIINYMIRYAHNASIFRMIVFSVISRIECAKLMISHKDFFRKDRLAIYRTTDPEVVKMREEMMNAASKALIGHLKRTSWMFWLWVGVYIGLHHSKNIADASGRLVRYSLKEARTGSVSPEYALAS